MKLVCGKLFLSTIDMMIVNISNEFLMIRVSIGSEVLERSDKLDVKWWLSIVSIVERFIQDNDLILFLCLWYRDY
jgi:hypothetical protein